MVPTWTVEPDSSAVEALAKPHTPPGVKYTTSVFAAGTFNKLFLLSPIKEYASSPCYIMRVALPVDPHFKTASEVATLRYLSTRTTIPVPHVIAYDASHENALGFEWILMTRLPGVPLKDLWSSPQLSWAERVQVIQTICGYIQQMQKYCFDKMGSLYLSDQIHHSLQHPHSRRATFIPLKADPQFSIGPVVAIPFFYGNRIKLPSDRGPFSVSSEWISSLLKLQIASTAHQKANLPPKDSEEDPGYDSDISELDGIIQAASELLPLVQKFIGGTNDNEEFVLYHNDLSINNILIDPITHRITGVVDWECVSLQPTWKARRPPQLLYGPEIDAEFYERNFDGPIPNVPPPRVIDQDNGEALMASEMQEYMEQMLLRRVFDSIIPPDGRQERLKRIFENKVGQVDVRWSWVVRWIKDIKSGKDPEPKDIEGVNLYFWPED